jgi:serine/threonine-protein kinase
VFKVNSSQPVDTVTAQNPTGSSKVFRGTKVQINVSQGVKQINVPNVVGQPYASARSTLLAAHLNVAKTLVDSNQPTDTVVDQDPSQGAQVGPGTTVTLSVSRGAPQTTPVPDVTNQDEPTARAILAGSGFEVTVTHQDVSDPSEQGIVLSQKPPGGANAPAGTTVTLVVGQYSGTGSTP